MSSEASFSRVLRGYDPEEVDALISKLRRELLTAKKLHDEVAEQSAALTRELAEIGQITSQKIAPTSVGLSAEVHKVLKKADKQASTIIARAEADGLLIRSSAEKTSNHLILTAQEGYDQTVSLARKEAERIIGDAHARAHEIVSDAEHEAKRMLADAREDSVAMRGEASTFVANQKAEAVNQIELEKSENQLKFEEMRLILSTQTSQKLISKELKELFRITADAASTRNRLAQELDARHKEASLQTDKYVASAQEQLSIARSKLRAIEKELTGSKERATAEIAQLQNDAREEIRRLTTSTQQLTQKQINDAERYVAAVLKSIYDQIEKLQIDRQKIGDYFHALQLELDKTLKPQSS